MTPKQLRILYIIILVCAIFIGAMMAYNMYNQITWESIVKVFG